MPQRPRRVPNGLDRQRRRSRVGTRVAWSCNNRMQITAYARRGGSIRQKSLQLIVTKAQPRLVLSNEGMASSFTTL